MASVVITRGTTLPNSSAKSDFHNLVDTATASVSNIVNADIDASAAIASSKLDLSSVGQVLTMTGKAVNEAEGANIASASTTNIWATDGNTFHITGTTTITSLSTAPQAGAIRRTIFDGALTLTHNASTLILPGGANITTAAGDVAIWYADTTTQIRCISYMPASGQAVVPVSAATQSEMESASSTSVYVSPGRIKNSPNVPKVGAGFNGSSSSPITPGYSFGVNGNITKGSTGTYTVTFSTDFANTDYFMTEQAWDTTVGVGCSLRFLTKNVGSCVIECYRQNTGTLTDAEEIGFAIWGDQ